MKQAKRPTRRQRILIEKWHLNSNNWLVLECYPDKLKVVHRHTDTLRVIPEGLK